MPKYNLEQVIFYIKDNQEHSAEVLAIKHIANQFPSYFSPFGEPSKPGVWYATCHGVFEEKDCFPNKDSLLAQL